VGRRRASWTWHSDGELLSEIEETRRLIDQARRAAGMAPGVEEQLPELERRLQELAERAADKAVLFVMEALPGDDWEDLKLAHPPSDADLDRWRQQSKANPFAAMPEWNWRTLAPDLIALCLVEPDWDEAKVREWWKDLSAADQKAVFNIAVDLQESRVNVPFFAAATDTTSGGGGSSNTAPSEESP
jgi:hypothetical protein